MKIHKCANHGKRICILCVAQTAIFPVEHLMWTKAPILRNLAIFFGL